MVVETNYADTNFLTVGGGSPASVSMSHNSSNLLSYESQ